MKTLTIVLPRCSISHEQIVLALVQGRPYQGAVELFHTLATQSGIQITNITTTLTLMGKVQLRAELIGEVNSAAVVAAGGDIYQQGKIDFLLYQDEEKQSKIWIHGSWRRTWL